MGPYVFVLREAGVQPVLQSFEDVIPEDYHNIQTHSVKLSLLEEAQQRQQLMADEIERSRHSPDLTQQQQRMAMGGLELMTPPMTGCDQILVHLEETVNCERGRDAKITTLPSASSSSQQSSVFLSPTSEAENSGFW